MKASLIQKISFVLVLLLLSVFTNGQYVFFFAIWLFTSLLLFAVRSLKKWQSYVVALVFIFISYYVGYDFAPFLPIIVSIITALLFSSLAAVPYLIDAFFARKRSSFLSTLIFPASVVLMEYVYNQLNQFGSFGHFAYTQQSQLELLQSISIFGMSYITFLIAWFASVSNWIYEHRTAWKRVKKGALIYALVLGLTLAFGAYRIQFHSPDAHTVRVASISAQDHLKASIDIQGMNTPETAQEALAQTRQSISKLNQYLFDKSMEEANAGAQLVFWAEGNANILKQDEDTLYQQASQVAQTHGIYLGIAVAVIDQTQEKFLENKFVIFDKNGNKAIDYWKGISVPIAEAPISNNKETAIQPIETDFGTLAAVICFDLDFPDYIKAAAGSDILIAPSNDWEELGSLHTNMAKYRGIEQGFNLIRQTSAGVSRGTDYTGKTLSEMNHFTDAGKVMITQIPTRGTTTLYSSIGDSFIAFCFLLLVFVGIKLKREKLEHA